MRRCPDLCPKINDAARTAEDTTVCKNAEPLLQLIVWGEDGMMNAVIKGARITVQFLDDGAVAVHQAKLPELTSAAIQIQHAQLFTRHSEPLRTCGLTSPDIRSRCEPAAARAKT